jgi:hypothetical protein
MDQIKRPEIPTVFIKAAEQIDLLSVFLPTIEVAAQHIKIDVNPKY